MRVLWDHFEGTLGSICRYPGVILKLFWGYCEKLWDHFGGTCRVTMTVVWGHLVSTLEVTLVVSWGHLEGTPDVTLGVL